MGNSLEINLSLADRTWIAGKGNPKSINT